MCRREIATSSTRERARAFHAASHIEKGKMVIHHCTLSGDDDDDVASYIEYGRRQWTRSLVPRRDETRRDDRGWTAQHERTRGEDIVVIILLVVARVVGLQARNSEIV